MTRQITMPRLISFSYIDTAGQYHQDAVIAKNQKDAREMIKVGYKVRKPLSKNLYVSSGVKVSDAYAKERAEHLLRSHVAGLTLRSETEKF